MIVSIFGSAFLQPESPAYRDARRMGELVAREGWSLATGGYAGTMEAASRGAAEAGGHILGVTCETMTRAGRRANPWITEEIRRASARERLFTLVDMAGAVIALNGGIGTLTEITFCWNQIQLGEISPRPIVLTGSVWRSTFQEFFRTSGDYLQAREKAMLEFADSPDEAIGKIKVRAV